VWCSPHKVYRVEKSIALAFDTKLSIKIILWRERKLETIIIIFKHLKN